MSTMQMTGRSGVPTPRVGRAHPARASRAGVRLTRRGRLVVVAVLAALLVVGFSMGRVSSQAAGPARHHAPTTVTVAPGESLWSLAARVAPHADPRLVVAEIERLNHLTGAQVYAGQQLVLG